MNSSYKYVNCPHCGKKLFRIINESEYIKIYIWCKSCKKEIEITKESQEPKVK